MTVLWLFKLFILIRSVEFHKKFLVCDLPQGLAVKELVHPNLAVYLLFNCQ
jgi:hypothetical protein